MKRRVIAVFFLLLAALGVFLGANYYLSVYLPIKQIDDAVEKQQELIRSVRPIILDATEQPEKYIGKSADIFESQETSPLSDIEQINDETVAWIYIPDTNIDYPVMQSDDNDFYLHNGADGEYNNEVGCPFLDYRCESDFTGFNSIVYGHHLTEGRMFADIAKYSENEYLSEHDKGFLVLDDSVHEVNFFAYLNVESTSAVYHTVFVTPRDRDDYLDHIFSSAKYTPAMTRENLNNTDELHLLLLSTCTFESDESRGVLVGVIGE